MPRLIPGSLLLALAAAVVARTHAAGVFTDTECTCSLFAASRNSKCVRPVLGSPGQCTVEPCNGGYTCDMAGTKVCARSTGGSCTKWSAAPGEDMASGSISCTEGPAECITALDAAATTAAPLTTTKVAATTVAARRTTAPRTTTTAPRTAKPPARRTTTTAPTTTTTKSATTTTTTATTTAPFSTKACTSMNCPMCHVPNMDCDACIPDTSLSYLEVATCDPCRGLPANYCSATYGLPSSYKCCGRASPCKLRLVSRGYPLNSMAMLCSSKCDLNCDATSAGLCAPYEKIPLTRTLDSTRVREVRRC
jgi:hypothetical protein